MQRNKSFVVVLAALVFASLTQAQTGIPGIAQGVPVMVQGVPVMVQGVPVMAQGAPIGNMQDPRSGARAGSGSSFLGAAGVEWGRLGLKAGLDLNKLIRAPLLVYTDPFTQQWAAGPPGSPVSALADDYYCLHFGFFCKKELEFEKTTHIPLRFRLGSLEQCNMLEGKK